MAAQTQNQNPINTPFNWEQIGKYAEEEATREITGLNAPLEAQVGTYGRQQEAAHKNIAAEGARLLPYVQGAAGQVTQAYGGALSMEQQVFSAAGTRMNQLHQQAAAEAQQLAQQVGGPVGTGQFTQALEPFEGAQNTLGAGEMLHSLGLAQAGVQEAQGYAGQVFPALITENEAKSDQYYKDQIKELQDQINKNAGTKSALVDQKKLELLQSERAFRQQILQNKMDRTKMKRDWKATQWAHKSSQLRDQLSIAAAKRAKIQLGLSERASARADRSLNASIAHMSRADRLAAQRLGLSKAEFAARLQHQKQTARVGAAKVSDAIQKDAISLIQAAMGGGKPVSRTYRAYVPGGAGKSKFAAPSGAYWDPKKGRWYRIGHETITPQEYQQITGEVTGAGGHPISDPNRMFRYMRGSLPQLGRKATINLIRAQLNVPKWNPGQRAAYVSGNLHGMPISELKGLARDNGYTGPLGKKASRQAIIDYLIHVTPTPNPR